MNWKFNCVTFKGSLLHALRVHRLGVLAGFHRPQANFSALQRLLIATGVSPPSHSYYAPHSLRGGSVMALIFLGVPGAVIQARGFWSSERKRSNLYFDAREVYCVTECSIFLWACISSFCALGHSVAQFPSVPPSKTMVLVDWRSLVVFMLMVAPVTSFEISPGDSEQESPGMYSPF